MRGSPVWGGQRKQSPDPHPGDRHQRRGDQGQHAGQRRPGGRPGQLPPPPTSAPPPPQPRTAARAIPEPGTGSRAALPGSHHLRRLPRRPEIPDRAQPLQPDQEGAHQLDDKPRSAERDHQPDGRQVPAGRQGVGSRPAPAAAAPHPVHRQRDQPMAAACLLVPGASPGRPQQLRRPEGHPDQRLLRHGGCAILPLLPIHSRSPARPDCLVAGQRLLPVVLVPFLICGARDVILRRSLALRR